MESKLKFTSGREVFCVKYQEERIFTPCPACNTRGIIKCKDNVFYPCPRCHGAKGEATKTGNCQWTVTGPYRICESYYKPECGETIYILYVFNPAIGPIPREFCEETNMFLDLESAELECERRNKNVR